MVQFADFEPLIEGRAGHPHGLEWFCNEHAQAAQALAASTSSEALSKLHGTYGIFPPMNPSPIVTPSFGLLMWGQMPHGSLPFFAMFRKRPLQRPGSCWQAGFSKSHKAGKAPS